MPFPGDVWEVIAAGTRAKLPDWVQRTYDHYAWGDASRWGVVLLDAGYHPEINKLSVQFGELVQLPDAKRWREILPRLEFGRLPVGVVVAVEGAVLRQSSTHPVRTVMGLLVDGTYCEIYHERPDPPRLARKPAAPGAANCLVAALEANNAWGVDEIGTSPRSHQLDSSVIGDATREALPGWVRATYDLHEWGSTRRFTFAPIKASKTSPSDVDVGPEGPISADAPAELTSDQGKRWLLDAITQLHFDPAVVGVIVAAPWEVRSSDPLRISRLVIGLLADGSYAEIHCESGDEPRVETTPTVSHDIVARLASALSSSLA